MVFITLKEMWNERANIVKVIHYITPVMFEPGQSIFKVHFVPNQPKCCYFHARIASKLILTLSDPSQKFPN